MDGERTNTSGLNQGDSINRTTQSTPLGFTERNGSTIINELPPPYQLECETKYYESSENSNPTNNSIIQQQPSKMDDQPVTFIVPEEIITIEQLPYVKDYYVSLFKIYNRKN